MGIETQRLEREQELTYDPTVMIELCAKWLHNGTASLSHQHMRDGKADRLGLASRSHGPVGDLCYGQNCDGLCWCAVGLVFCGVATCYNLWRARNT